MVNVDYSNYPFLIEYKGFIYFTNFNDHNRLIYYHSWNGKETIEEAGDIYKIKTDGTMSKKIYAGNASNMKLQSGYLYFINQNGLGSGKLIRINLDGKDLKDLTVKEDHKTWVYIDYAWEYGVDKDKIAYLSWTDEEYVFDSRTGERIKSTGQVNFSVRHDGWIYYISKGIANRKLIKYNPSTNQKILLATGSLSDMSINNGSLYYLINTTGIGKELYIINLQTNKRSLVTNEKAISVRLIQEFKTAPAKDEKIKS